MTAILRSLRDLPRSLIPSTWLAGLVAIVIGYSSSLVLVFQAATNAGLNQGQLASWIWAIITGSGAACVILSISYRQPIIGAWSTAGSALLVVSLGHYTFAQAVGAYLIAGLAVTALGLSGGFGRLLALVPTPIVSGMLAGILIKFGLGLFTALGERTLMVGAMVIAFLLLRRFAFRAPTVGALLAGLAVAFATNEVNFTGVQLSLAVPLWTWPEFSLGAILGLSLPLFVLAMVSQNAPSIAIVHAAGYDAPIDLPTTVTGILSLLTAPFGGHGINLAVLTAAIVTSPEAHPDHDRRYAAGVATGCWYLLTGLFGATAVGIFAGLPKELIAAVAGLALLGATANALTGAMREPDAREGALIAFLVTAADLAFFGIGAPFWGLLIGALAQRALTWRRGV